METTDYCDYKLSLALKSAGFDEPCDHYYNGHGNLNRYADTDRINRNTNGHHTPSCSAPHIFHAQKWLRERAIEVDVTPIFSHGGRDGYDWDIYDDFSGYPAIRGTLPFAETYEQALSAGISAALELIKKGE